MRRLWARLALAFLLVTLLTVGAVALVVRTTTESSFRAYISQNNSGFANIDTLAGTLQEHYAEEGSWAGAASLLPTRGGRNQDGRGAQLLLAGAAGVVVATTDAALLGTQLDDAALENAYPLVVNGVIVGFLAQQTPGELLLGEAEAAFLQETSTLLLVTAAGIGLLALALGLGLSWQLTRPLQQLTETAGGLAAGELGRQVAVSGTVEVTALADAFNAMSAQLAEGEALRQRMAADIAHELRTPVSVIRGHLEAMLDGVYPLDGEHLAVAHGQTLHLARLVEDMRLLTLAESGQLPLNRAHTSPEALITQARDRFLPLAADAGLVLAADIAPGLPDVNVDPDRIQQVLANLLSNALRHTSPGGQITLRAAAAGAGVRFAVENDGAPLAPEQLAHIFDRFWRADDARRRDGEDRGSGLGLAITRQLVLLHGGRIRADSFRADSFRAEDRAAVTVLAFWLPGG